MASFSPAPSNIVLLERLEGDVGTSYVPVAIAAAPPCAADSQCECLHPQPASSHDHDTCTEHAPDDAPLGSAAYHFRLLNASIATASLITASCSRPLFLTVYVQS